MRRLPLLSLLLLTACPAAAPLAVVANRSGAIANGTDAVLITATSPQPGFIDFTVSAGGQLTTPRVQTDASGAATTTLTATTPGAITVTATMATASGTTTVTFTSPASPHLRFQTSPSNTMAQNLLRPIPVVVVEDGAGVVTSSSASVTVGITPGSCAATLDASSQLTVNAVQGVASFYGLKSSLVATGCTLTATSGTLPSAVSAAFDLQ